MSDHERPIEDSRSPVTRETDIRRALQINCAFLASIAKQFKLDEATTRATIRHEGKVLAEVSLGEALDIANEALEPATGLSGDRTAAKPNTGL